MRYHDSMGRIRAGPQSTHCGVWPLVLEHNRPRLRPGLDAGRWALEETRRIVSDTLGEAGVDVYLFGSRARGDARPTSDIDIALDAHGRPVPATLMAKLRDRLESSLVPFEVDLVDLCTASETLRRRVLEEGRRWKP